MDFTNSPHRHNASMRPIKKGPLHHTLSIWKRWLWPCHSQNASSPCNLHLVPLLHPHLLSGDSPADPAENGTAAEPDDSCTASTRRFIKNRERNKMNKKAVKDQAWKGNCCVFRSYESHQQPKRLHPSSSADVLTLHALTDFRVFGSSSEASLSSDFLFQVLLMFQQVNHCLHGTLRNSGTLACLRERKVQHAPIATNQSILAYNLKDTKLTMLNCSYFGRDRLRPMFSLRFRDPSTIQSSCFIQDI